MERDYNKNRRSFRSERSENRRGYGAEQGERYTAGSVGNRNTTRRFERTSERDNGERRERNFNREKDTYRERQEVRRPPGTIIRIIIVLSTAIGKRFPGERKKD